MTEHNRSEFDANKPTNRRVCTNTANMKQICFHNKVLLIKCALNIFNHTDVCLQWNINVFISLHATSSLSSRLYLTGMKMSSFPL